MISAHTERLLPRQAFLFFGHHPDERLVWHGTANEQIDLGAGGLRIIGHCALHSAPSRYDIHSAVLPGLLGISSGFQNQGQSGIPRSRLCGRRLSSLMPSMKPPGLEMVRPSVSIMKPHAADPCIVAMAERVYHGFAESLRVEIRHVHMYQSAHDFVAGVPWLY